MRERSIDRLFRRYRDHRDARALAELFDCVAPELARIAAHFAKTSDEVEDAVQTAFLTAIERPEMVDRDRPFLPWMIGVVTNRCRDLARKRSRTPEPDRVRSPAPSDPLVQAETEEFQVAVERGVEGLAPKYRSAVHAHLAEGLAPREIAAREGITPNAASVRLHRGLRALRKALPGGFALGAVGLVGTPALADVKAHVLHVATGSKAVAIVGAPKGILIAAVALLGGTLSLAALVLLSSTDETPLSRAAGPVLSSEEASQQTSVESEAGLVAPAESEWVRRVPTPLDSSGAATATALFRLRVLNATTRSPVPDATCMGGADGEASILARTDADGYAVFADAGEFALLNRVDAAGHVSWRRSLRAGEASSGVEGFRHATPKPSDLTEILLEPGTTQSGSVLDRKTREPIAGALIYAFRATRGTPKPILAQPVGLSDRNGAFMVDGGVPLTNETGGNVLLFAVAPAVDGAPERTGVSSFPVLESTGGPPVEILCRSSLRAQITVRDESGQPLAGVLVTARPGGPPWGLDWTSSEALTTFERDHPEELLQSCLAETDARGVASFDRLSAGSPQGMTGQEPYEPLWPFGFQIVDETWSGQIDQAFLAASKVGEFEVEAVKTRWVRVTGRCVLENGEALASARVGHVHPKANSAQTQADEMGRFDLGEFASAQFPLRLSAHPERGPSAEALVALPDLGQDEVSVLFEHAVAVGVRGRVLDEFGEGVPGVQLMLLTEGRNDRMESWGSQGEFAFPDAGSGRHELRLIAPDGRTMVLHVEAGPEPTDVMLPSREAEITLVLDLVEKGENAERPVPVSVRFTNEMGGGFEGGHDSLGSVTVSPRSIHREPGLVRVEGIPPGMWVVRLVCEGFPVRTLAFEFEEASGVTRQQVTLERAGILTGRVLDGLESEPSFLDFSKIHLDEHKYSERPLKYWHLDNISALALEPVFQFELTPGQWWVSAHQEGRAAFMFVDVVSGENPRLDLSLEPCARIELNVSGLPAGQIPLLELRLGILRIRHAPKVGFDESGMFYLVPAGEVEWRVNVIRERVTGVVSELARGQWTLEPGETRRIDL